MQKRRNGGKARRHAAGGKRWLVALRRRFAPWCFAGFAAVAGCQHNQPATNKSAATSSDPLLGGAAPAPAQRAAALNGSTPQNLPPPPPAGTSLTSNAALAAGNSGNAVLDPTHDLRISDSARAPGASPTPANGNWSGAALQRPEPVGASPPSTLTASASPQFGGVDDALAQLQNRGVNYLRLEHVEADLWQLTCSVPNRQSPTVSTTYDAKGRTAVEVIRTVLNRIDQAR